MFWRQNVDFIIIGQSLVSLKLAENQVLISTSFELFNQQIVCRSGGIVFVVFDLVVEVVDAF